MPEFRQTYFGLRPHHDVVKTMSLVDFHDSDDDTHSKFSVIEKKDDGLGPVSAFTRYHGGIRGVDKNGNPSNVIYYIGIIDILQKYNTKKKTEHFFKGFSNDRSQISAVNANDYADRFMDFIFDAIVLDEEESET